MIKHIVICLALIALAYHSNAALLGESNGIASETGSKIAFMANNREGANGLGHVGFGYQRDDGKFVFGSFGPLNEELTINNVPAISDGLLAIKILDNIDDVRAYLSSNGYDTFKEFRVEVSRQDDSWNFIVAHRNSDYNVFSSAIDMESSDNWNCLTMAIAVLENFGVQNLPPISDPRPNYYYDSITTSNTQSLQAQPTAMPTRQFSGSKVQSAAEPILQLSGSGFSDWLQLDRLQTRLESTRGSEGLEDWGGHPRGMSRGQSSNWVPPNIPTTHTPGYTTQQSFDDSGLGTGDVQVTLTWHSSADIDLYVQDPYGDTVSYQSDSVSSGGQLDRDNQCDNFEMGRAENIFWPDNGAPSGTYKVWVNYYADCSDVGPVAWTVRTAVKGQAKTYSGIINGVGGDQDVTTFTI